MITSMIICVIKDGTSSAYIQVFSNMVSNVRTIMPDFAFTASSGSEVTNALCIFMLSAAYARILAIGSHVLRPDGVTSHVLKNQKLERQFISPLDLITSYTKELSQNNFSEFLNLLFTDFQSESNETNVQSLFHIFDTNSDGKISSSETHRMWQDWVEVVLCPKYAIIIVDVQNDFIDGNLSVRNVSDNQHPECIVPVINSILYDLQWDLVVYTQDWHPENHISFFENKDNRTLHNSSNLTRDEAK
ncbi:hypothetical protein V5799_015218, partial [Amblyomma americanum]